MQCCVFGMEAHKYFLFKKGLIFSCLPRCLPLSLTVVEDGLMSTKEKATVEHICSFRADLVCRDLPKLAPFEPLSLSIFLPNT